MNFVFSDNPSHNSMRLIYKIEQCRTFMESSIAVLFNFLELEPRIFLHFQRSLKSFRIFFGNSYIQFMVIISQFCFTCTEGKLR